MNPRPLWPQDCTGAVDVIRSFSLAAHPQPDNLREPEFETLQLHAGQDVDPATNARAPPIYASTSFVFNDSAVRATSRGVAPKGDRFPRSCRTCRSARRRSIWPPCVREHLFSHREPYGGTSPGFPPRAFHSCSLVVVSGHADACPQDVFEKRIAALEGGVAAVAASSGQAAQFMAISNIAGAGDNIVSTSYLYGGVSDLPVC